MAKLDTVDLSNIGQKVILFGPPKAGKTELAGKLAAHFNTLWFDLEHGYLTLKKFPVEIQRNIELIRVPDNRQNHLAITSMLKVTDGKPVTICDLHGIVGAMCPKCKMATVSGNVHNVGQMVKIDIEMLGPNDLVVVDSLTQLSHSAMGKTFGGQTEDNIKPEYSNYMGQGFFLDKFLTCIQQSRANWCVISHEEALTQEDKIEKIVPMAGTRNFSRNTARYFDHVVYVSIKNRKYHQNSSGVSDMKILTGSRTNVDLADPLSEGLITMFRTVKGTEENNKAVAAVNKISPAPAEPEVVKEKPAMNPALAAKLAASKAKK